MDSLNLFTYQSGTTFLHRSPVYAKLLILCILSIVIFTGGWYTSLILAPVAYIIGILCGFSFRNTLREQKGILYYGLFLSAFTAITACFNTDNITAIVIFNAAVPSILFTVKLLITTQLASLIFKTTTTRSILSLFEQIEAYAPKVVKKQRFSLKFTLLITFIPRVFDTWQTLSIAWDARGGMLKKNRGIRKIIYLIPALFSSLLEKASEMFYAITSRGL